MTGPHQDRPLLTAGAPLGVADAAAVLLHGRGATAEGVLDLADEFYRHGLALVAPQAARNRWYPNSFLASVESNEPWLSSALQAVRDAIATVNDAGIPTDRILVFGVSQGACLASEFVARNPTRYGGIAVSSGGLVGPEGTTRDYDGMLDGTPTLVGCSATDPHVPLERVRETVDVFERMDADVTERIDDEPGHGITDAEIGIVREIVTELLPTDEGETHR